MKLPFGKSKSGGHDHKHDHDHSEIKKPKKINALEGVSLPEGATAIVIGLDVSANPFIRSVGPVSQAQLALMSSYFTGLVMANWQQLLNPQPTEPSVAEVTDVPAAPEAPQE